MSNDAEYLGTLKAAILIQHRCKAIHAETVFVEEKTADGETVWQGNVESFDLIGHEEAKTCYAWQHVDDKSGAKVFAVLGSKFIDSSKRAIQAAIFTGAQSTVHRFSKKMELLKQQLEECKKFFRQMGMKIENLAAAIHPGQGIHEAINQKRNPAR